MSVFHINRSSDNYLSREYVSYVDPMCVGFSVRNNSGGYTLLLRIQYLHKSYNCVLFSVITNPLDVLRANIQVRRIGSFVLAIQQLWAEERFNLFKKGLSARITQSCISSAFVVTGFVINLFKISFNLISICFQVMKHLNGL